MQKFKVYFWKNLPKKMFKEIKNRYKENKKDYITVYVCDTFEEMYKLGDKLEKEELEKNYGARTFCYTKNYWNIETGEYVKTSHDCGHILFNKEYFYADSVSHEVSHAIVGYFSRKIKEKEEIFCKTDKYGKILKENDEIEELFCYMLGNITNEIFCQVDV